jgi:3-deoxy-D-manno-octulosonic-acid transferase
MHSTVAGDTRFDRVQTIAGRFEPVPFLEEFTTGKMVVVAGSTWRMMKRCCMAF